MANYGGLIMAWRRDDPQCNESKKIVWTVAPYLRGRGVDIGAGDFKILPHAISVDDGSHAQFGFSHRPDINSDATKLDVFGSASMDWVYSSHTLEHVVDMVATLREWWRLVKPGGYLLLYLPHKDFYPHAGTEGANPDHKRDLLPEDVITAMPGGWDLIRNEDRNLDMEYSFLQVYRKLQDNKSRKRSYLVKDHQAKGRALVVRYGAFGDLLQATSVIKGLKDQGYHVTLHASMPGVDVVKHDPNIDQIIIFDKDQVPNANLADFWAVQKKEYDKFVNLSESVEGTLLAMPGRAAHGWNPLTRHSMMNRNYLEFQHAIAGLPHRPQVRFFATAEEKNRARNIRSKMGNGPIIMWSLAGSSVHKTWAGLDNILANLMLSYPESEVVLVGGPEGVILEQGWENEKRVHKTCGKWNIRMTLAFLAECDMVIGPETGVLNAASHMDMAKVIFLSHSTVENLTRDWVNTTSLWSRNTKCFGRGDNEAPSCHSMVYSWDTCTKDENSGTAQCQVNIGVEEAWNAIASSLSQIVRDKQALKAA